MVPLDDYLISGPGEFLGEPKEIAQLAIQCGANSLLGFPGLFRDLGPSTNHVARILNLTASTKFFDHNRKGIVSNLETAIALGVEGVAVHVNFSSKFEHEMLCNAALVVSTADGYGYPVLFLAYPRSENIDGSDNNYLDTKSSSPVEYLKMLIRCVAASVELGASAIKTQYPGSTDGVAELVRVGRGRPIFIAGGPLKDEAGLRNLIDSSMEGGAAGVSLGRNTYANPQFRDVIEYIVGLQNDGGNSGKI